MDDSIAEFATGQAVFFQDGVWAYNQIKGQSVSDNDLGVFPIYIGAKGEENQGLNQVISNYWCVNSKVSEKDQQATEKFLSWLVTSDTALKAISQDMGLVSPFKGFDNEKYQVTNPLVGVNREYQKAGKTDVISVPTVSHQWEQNLGSAELNYAQGNGSWDDVVKVFTNDWASEYKLLTASEETLYDHYDRSGHQALVAPVCTTDMLRFRPRLRSAAGDGYLSQLHRIHHDHRCRIRRLEKLCQSIPGSRLPACAAVHSGLHHRHHHIDQCRRILRRLYVHEAMRGAKLFRSVFFMPNLIGGIVLGYIWQLLLNGVLAHWNISLTYHAKYGFIGMVILVCWQQIGYMMVIYIAGLQNVPGDVIEAASVDGATPKQILWSITIPLMMPSITVCSFLTVTNGFKLFDQNLALTNGAPSNTSEMLA